MRISVYRNDDIPAFGAYLRKDGPPANTPIILINVEALFSEFIDENGNVEPATVYDRKRFLIETMMHEFGHVIEHFLGLEDNEEEIERAIASWVPSNSEQHGAPESGG
jgi:hypothetical protein